MSNLTKLFLLTLLCSAYALAASPDIHSEIQRVYSFQPHLLNDAQRAASSVQLDKFWENAKANRDVYVSGLRRELGDASNPPFFFFDGSMLLLDLSNSEQDRKIAAAAIAHCDLRDVTDDGYFHSVHALAAQGENTTAAAFRILENPKFQVFIPQHVLTLGQNYSLIYMLLPTEQGFWLSAAIDRLKTEKDSTAQKSLLLLLWYAQTDSADSAIQSIAHDHARSDEVKKYANELANQKSSLAATLKARLTSEAEIRKQRQVRMQAVSDEALDDLNELTMQLVALRKK